jgi:hypothetical protein
LFRPPFHFNLVHRLQIENVLLRAQSHFEPDASRSEREDQKQRASAGLNRWQNSCAEGVFELGQVDLGQAYDLAIRLQTNRGTTSPHPVDLLHPALAVVSEATHYLTFRLAARQIAAKAGLKVLPFG